MKKDFCGWHAMEASAQKRNPPIFFYEREIWYCAAGTNIGHEQDGIGKKFLRPFLILKKFPNGTFLGVPLTRTKRHGPFYFTFLVFDGTSTALLSQTTHMDAKRLMERIDEMPISKFEALKEKFIELLK